MSTQELRYAPYEQDGFQSRNSDGQVASLTVPEFLAHPRGRYALSHPGQWIPVMTGRNTTVTITLRLPVELVKEFDKRASDAHQTRNAYLRKLLEAKAK